MPQPAPKSVDDIITRLETFLETNTRPGDIERIRIIEYLKALKRTDPANAFLGLGALACVEKDEDSMRRYYKNALEYSAYSPVVFFNYGISLIWMGYLDEAVDAFSQSIDRGLNNYESINKLAISAMCTGNGELELKVLRHANKLKCDGPDILRLAAVVACANTDDPDEMDHMLSLAFSDDDLRKNSVPVTEEEWNRMKNLADELRSYL